MNDNNRLTFYLLKDTYLGFSCGEYFLTKTDSRSDEGLALEILALESFYGCQIT